MSNHESGSPISSSSTETQGSLEIDRNYYLWLASGDTGLELDGVLRETGDFYRKHQRVHALLSLVQDRLMEVTVSDPPILTLTELGAEKLKELDVKPRAQSSSSYRAPR